MPLKRSATDDPAGIAASIVDGQLYGCGDAVIGIIGPEYLYDGKEIIRAGLEDLAAAGVTYVMGVSGADDVMLNDQSTSLTDRRPDLALLQARHPGAAR